MESVLESGARRTCTTAAGGGASADTEGEDSPECPHPTQTPIQTAIKAIPASIPGGMKDDLLGISTVTHFEPQLLASHRTYRGPQRDDPRLELTPWKLASEEELPQSLTWV